MKVDTEKCIFCKLCTRLGCPAITPIEEKSHIAPERCISCTVCAQVCPKDAIHFVDEEGMHIHDTSLEEFRKSGGKK